MGRPKAVRRKMISPFRESASRCLVSLNPRSHRGDNAVLRTSRRQLREKIVPLLQAGDYPGLTALAGQESGVAAILMQFLYDPGALLYWRALEGLGVVAGSHPEQVRQTHQPAPLPAQRGFGEQRLGRGRGPGGDRAGPDRPGERNHPHVHRHPGGTLFPGVHALGRGPVGGSAGGTSP